VQDLIGENVVVLGSPDTKRRDSTDKRNKPSIL
jgi:hypothetical protein